MKVHFPKSIIDEDGCIQMTIPTDAYELESLSDEILKNIIEEGHFTEVDYPFTLKRNFFKSR